MVGFSDSVTVFDANNESRELRLHPDGKFYDAQDDQDSDNLGNESLHLSEAEDDTEFIDAFSTMPIGDSDNMMSLSTLNKSANDLWNDSFEFGADGNASMSQFHDTKTKAVPMENSMTLEDLPNLVAASNGNSSSDTLSSTPKKNEDEVEEDPTRQFVKQMGYGLMLQGGLQFAMNPLMRIGKRLFSSEGNEEDVLEDAAAAQMMVNRSGQLQHGMTTRVGDFSSFAHASAHESSRNMTGAFVLQQDVTAQVMKQAMIQAAQSAGASVGQGAATMTVAASAGAAAGGATAVAAGGAAAAATMSAKFAIGVAVGSIIAVGGLGGATLGSYMGEKELNVDVSTPVFAKQELASYRFDTLDLAAGIAPTASPESWNSLGYLPTSSPEKKFVSNVDPDRPLPSSPGITPTTSTIGSPAMAPTPGTIGIPTDGSAGNPASLIIATQYPSLRTPGEWSTFIPSTSPIPTSTNKPTEEFVSFPTMTPIPTVSRGFLTTSPSYDATTFPTETTAPSVRAVTTKSPALLDPIASSSFSPSTSSSARTGMPTRLPTVNFSDGPAVSFSGTPTIDSNSSSPVQIPTATNSPLSSPSLVATVRPSTSSAVPTTTTADSPSSAPISTTTGPISIPSVTVDEPTSVPSFKPSLSMPGSMSPTTLIGNPSTSPSNDPNFDNPSSTPSTKPTYMPTSDDTGIPSVATEQPSSLPSPLFSSPPTVTVDEPTSVPSFKPSLSMPGSMSPTTLIGNPSTSPSNDPNFDNPSSTPSSKPTYMPTSDDTGIPSVATEQPSSLPIPLFSSPPTVTVDEPTSVPSFKPSLSMPGSMSPTTLIGNPSTSPSNDPNFDNPSSTPSSKPTYMPTRADTGTPSVATEQPSSIPSPLSSSSPSTLPRPTATTGSPITSPNMNPVAISEMPSLLPSDYPSFVPSVVPSAIPAPMPTNNPTSNPSAASEHPSSVPSVVLMRPTATTGSPITTPVSNPPVNPLTIPTDHPSSLPSPGPTSLPTNDPTSNPSGTTDYPTSVPTSRPSSMPTLTPTKGPTDNPTVAPVVVPVPTELQPVPVAPSPVMAPVPIAPQPTPVAPSPVMAPVPIAPQPTPVVPSPVVAPVPIAPQPTPVAPSPVGSGPVGSIIGFSLTDGAGNILIPFLFRGQTINTAVYGTNLRVRALYLTIWGPVNSVNFDISNNNGGGSSSIWSRPGPIFETDNRFLRFSSVSIKAIPLPSSSNQGNKGVEVGLNLSIIGTIS